jgi:hypothetical protein
MLRSGRFKSQLLTPDFLKNESLQACQSLQPFISLWQGKFITESEMAAIFIFIFSFLRRPRDFLGGTHKENFTINDCSRLISGKEFLDRLRPTLGPKWLNFKSLNRLDIEDPFLQFICRRSLRSIPISVARALVAWQNGTYSLKLRTDIPSPEEVMKMQAQGYRCVSILFSESEISRFVENERDVLGFIIHDLIHADHFFINPITASQQIRFSEKMTAVYANPKIQQMMIKDPHFKVELQYLISDMNSVPLHLLKTLKAILLGFYKRREHLDWKKSLPLGLESDFFCMFREVLAPWNLSSEVMAAAERLNTSQFCESEDALLIDSFL